ncbi:aminotransferase class I/II-fold pyridoxal phosphate-dependent enzyme [Haloplasma contractile]|uniref:Glycine C-acetyltransferase protein n=1 Tax=Haloplasma contractile SSD-17B TaxID=1033810 RepID=U2FJC4_9MOLU|nr:pyridoxal phosphate-dependent aminotransferase family protein [Haloplasma contractile]ERJ11369.1 glycine C-acetyltransferase protein [Haloplasma contractile SSD-17B]
MSYEDIFNKCKSSEGYFGEFRAAGDRYYTMPVLESIPGTTMKFQGKDCIMWSVNNYLGLAENEEIKQVAVDTVKEWGVSGPMGSRMMSGNTLNHIELEQQLASFAQKEAAILFNYGYLGVIGTINSIVDEEDIIIMDKLAHASIVDGARGAISDRRKLRVFRHNDMDSLEHTLKKVNKIRKKGVIVLTEGVYGMTGDVAKLDEICRLKDQYDARLFVDDAHGFGVMGDNGRGTAEYFGVQDKVDLYFGTFAKAFASIGGFTAANKEVVEWIRYNARTQVFAKSLPMIYTKSLIKTLSLVENGGERRKRLFDVSRKLSEGLRELGFYVGKVESPIVAVFIPEASVKIAMEWIKYLREKGVFVTAVAYPVIPRNYIMFRMIPTASHTDEDVEKTIVAFKSLRNDRNINLDDVDWSGVEKLYGDR